MEHRQAVVMGYERFARIIGSLSVEHKTTGGLYVLDGKVVIVGPVGDEIREACSLHI